VADTLLSIWVTLYFLDFYFSHDLTRGYEIFVSNLTFLSFGVIEAQEVSDPNPYPEHEFLECFTSVHLLVNLTESLTVAVGKHSSLASTMANEVIDLPSR
jgi:hypothetical protein